jgi:hypothetical protein
MRSIQLIQPGYKVTLDSIAAASRGKRGASLLIGEQAHDTVLRMRASALNLTMKFALQPPSRIIFALPCKKYVRLMITSSAISSQTISLS